MVQIIRTYDEGIWKSNWTKHIQDLVDIDAMQFGFIPGKGAMDAIFIARQLQERYLEEKKKLSFASVDLEKAFDLVPERWLSGLWEN